MAYGLHEQSSRNNRKEVPLVRNSPKRGAVLACKHVRYYRNGAPNIGARVWCSDCQDMRHVASWEGWYYALCDTCRSTFTRANLDTLASNAKRHRCAKPAFRFWVWRNGWERISENIVYALDSDPLWTDTESSAANTGLAATETEAGP